MDFDEVHSSCLVLAGMAEEDCLHRIGVLAIRYGFWRDPTAMMLHLGSYESHGEKVDAKAPW
jgi:hypothetical protein